MHSGDKYLDRAGRTKSLNSKARVGPGYFSGPRMISTRFLSGDKSKKYKNK